MNLGIFIKKILFRVLSCLIPTKKMRVAFRENFVYDSRFSPNSTNSIILVDEKGRERKVKKIKGICIKFYGNNSLVKIYKPILFENCVLKLGNNNFVEIKSSNYCISEFVQPHMMREYSKLLIGKDFSCIGCKVYMHDEPNTTVTIGDDCLFSFGVIIWPSDGHAIIDSTNKSINKGQNIFIGNHVWLGMNATILKGVCIPDNSVVGANSTLVKASSSSIDEDGVIYAGIPAKIIKSGINWDRQNCYDYENK